MSSTLTQITFAAMIAHAYDTLATVFGVIIVLLLIVLLVQKEALRAWGGARAERWARALNVAIIPLLFAFAVIILMRLAALL